MFSITVYTRLYSIQYMKGINIILCGWRLDTLDNVVYLFPVHSRPANDHVEWTIPRKEIRWTSRCYGGLQGLPIHKSVHVPGPFIIYTSIKFLLRFESTAKITNCIYYKIFFAFNKNSEKDLRLFICFAMLYHENSY